MIDTSVGQQIDTKLLANYFDRLVNQFFKLLPIREKEAATFTTYSRSLQMEVLGCREFIIPFKNDATILTLISILQYFSDTPDIPIADVRREVFRAIDLLHKSKKTYAKAVDK